MEKTTYPPTSYSSTTPDVDASVEASLWQPPSASNGATSTAAQQWEAQSTGKRIIPAVVIGVAVAALVVGMNYQFKHNDHDTTLAQGQASESVINEAPPVTPAPEPAATTAPAVETAQPVAPPPDPAPVVKQRAETAPPAPAPRPAPATVTPRAPVVPPADSSLRAPTPEPTPTPAPVPTPNPSGQAPQPLTDTSPQPPLPVPAPTPTPQPAPEPN